jgi:hypothetical protein
MLKVVVLDFAEIQKTPLSGTGVLVKTGLKVLFYHRALTLF